MSKAADNRLVRNLAAEWGPKNVRVNAIAPGLVKTEFARALWEDEKRAAERVSNTPLRRLGEPRDIGGIAAFLASDAAPFVTRQVMVADGGVALVEWAWTTPPRSVPFAPNCAAGGART